jgi:hypothetical protein
MNRFRSTAILAAGVCATASMAQGAFMVETRVGGKADGNFGPGGDTTTVSTSTATTGAVGATSAIGSVFGGNGSVADTYVFSYRPGVNVDNTVYTPGQVLGSTSGFPGQGNLASGLVGGASGTYNVYFTVPQSINVSAAGSDFTITQDGAPIVLSAVNLNDGGTGPDTDPGAAFVGGANNAWYLLGSVTLAAGSTYTVTQESNDTGFVSQRSSAVMWELQVPEPSMAALFGIGALALGLSRRRA